MGPFGAVLLFFIVAFAANCKAENKVVCYYDSRSHFRTGQAKFEVSDIEPALNDCTHLVYGYAAINEGSYKLTPLNEQFDVIQNSYRKVTDFKKRFPKLKVLLSVGGNADVSGTDSQKNIKYRNLLETTSRRAAFVDSAVTLMKAYGFDGLDLAWEFPENKPKKIRSRIGGALHKIKKTLSGTKLVDDNAANHREQFVSLVRELRSAFKNENLLLSLTVLPNVNTTVYYDSRLLTPNLEFINIEAFDFYTPERNPKEADHPSPLYELVDRKLDENIDAQVKYWLNNGAPSNKIILGLPTYGRAWAWVGGDGKAAATPSDTDGPAEPGPYTKTAGLLSFPEVCTILNNDKKAKRISDPSRRRGSYVFKTPDENNNGGIWVGYEDVDTAGYKASYVKAKGLGGIAVVDLSLDDFRGTCGPDKFDILKGAKISL